MTKDKLIAKQQLEIEELKETINNYKTSCNEAFNLLNYAEQWNWKSPDFPKVAIKTICQARQTIEDI